MTHQRFSRALIGAMLILAALLPVGSLAHISTPIASPASDECVKSETDGRCLSLAPQGARVDLAEPTFSHSSEITNPLFPISDLQQVIQLGNEEFQPLRVEITLLPDTKTIEWNGQRIEAVISQYVAYSDGVIAEVALDYYAQADDGSVWYLGEDVANYEDGAVANTEGSWLAGEDGPPGMIMPANPQAGDVFRPENIPGLVFEEVTVLATGVNAEGPQGQVSGAILTEEHLLDDTFEHKLFAPGYGEFSAQAPAEHVIVALAVPADSRDAAIPTDLERMSSDVNGIGEAIASNDWETASQIVESVISTWETYSEAHDAVPTVLAIRMNDALGMLRTAIDAGDAEAARQATFVLRQSILDLELQYRPRADVDLERMKLWTQRLITDAGADDSAGVAGDTASLDSIWNRVDGSIGQSGAGDISGDLNELRDAVVAGDLDAASTATSQLQADLNGLQASD